MYPQLFGEVWAVSGVANCKEEGEVFWHEIRGIGGGGHGIEARQPLQLSTDVAFKTLYTSCIH
jgi:hypothetical protein